MRAPLLISLALFLAGGCGSSVSGSGGVSADSYVGKWTFGVGEIDPNCSISASAIDLSGQMVSISKVDSTHIQMSIGGGTSGGSVPVMCDVTFTVNGSSATANGGSSCAINDNGIAATVNVTSWTLSLSPAGTAIDMSMMGTATVAQIVSCTPTATGTLDKERTDAG